MVKFARRAVLGGLLYSQFCLATFWDCGDMAARYGYLPVALGAALAEIYSSLGPVAVEPDMRVGMTATMTTSDPASDMHRGLQFFFTHFQFVSAYRTPELLNQLLSEAPAQLPPLIVTHLVPALQAKLEQRLAQSRHGAVALLTSGHYPIVHQALLSEATLLTHSVGGEHSFALNTKEIHLAGGYCEECMATSVGRLLRGNRVKNDVTLVVHTPVTYSFRYETDDYPSPTLESLLFDTSPQVRADRARQFAQSLLGHRNLREDISLSRPDAPEPEVVFLGPDKRQMTVRFIR